MNAFGLHWAYYDDRFDWPDGHYAPSEELSLRSFQSIGFDADKSMQLFRSGFVLFDTLPTIVFDRYYSGFLRSYDFRTRIPLNDFAKWITRDPDAAFPPRPAARVLRAGSFADLQSQIADLQSRTGRQLVFRGQTEAYGLPRTIKNPTFTLASGEEPSLVPGVWRSMLRKHPSSFHEFSGLDLLEWSRVMYHEFDVEDIDRRVKAAIDRGEWMYSAQDMEDSDDPVLKRFGTARLDLSSGIDWNLAGLLNTLLQHYGLLSPHLDLTTDLSTALFFATHKFQPGNPAGYEHIGTRGGRSVLYVFRYDEREMGHYAQDRALNTLRPLRPERQSCVICRSATHAVNLAGDFLFAVIELDFDVPKAFRLETSFLFPGIDEDNFLRALKAGVSHPERVTDFSHTP